MIARVNVLALQTLQDTCIEPHLNYFQVNGCCKNSSDVCTLSKQTFNANECCQYQFASSRIEIADAPITEERYAGVEHAGILYYTVNRGLVAIDTRTDEIAWHIKNPWPVEWVDRVYAELDQELAMFDVGTIALFKTQIWYPLLRNTPAIDADEHLVWINSAGLGFPFIAGFDLTTGERKHVYDMTLPGSTFFNTDWTFPCPDGLRSRALRSGIALEREAGTSMAYIGTTNLNSYTLKNALEPETIYYPGAFTSTGTMAKINLATGEWVYDVRTTPTEILPTGTIPEESFAGTDHVTVKVPLEDGYRFEETATHATHGRREVFDFEAGKMRTVDFAKDTIFSTSDYYTDTTGVAVLGSNFVKYWSASTVGYLQNIPQGLISKTLRRGFQLSGRPWEAWGLNYYGANVWGQTATVVDEGKVCYPIGNSMVIPYAEELLFANMSNIVLDTSAVEVGGESVDIILQRIYQRLGVSKSPRGRRNLADSFTCTSRVDGTIVSILPSLALDVFNLAASGGVFNDQFGQPANQPYVLTFGPDADPPCGAVLIDDKHIGAWTKAGTAFVADPGSGSIVRVNEDDPIAGDGFLSVQPMQHVAKTTGWWGWLGGVNYGIATDGAGSMFAVLRNYAVDYEYAIHGDNVTYPSGWPSVDGSTIPFGMSYASCVNADGTIRWETPLVSNSLPSAPVFHDGKVYITMVQDDHGKLFVLDGATGKIEHTFLTTGGAVWGPNVVADKIYTRTGISAFGSDAPSTHFEKFKIR
jgi:hypothetical protein